MARTNLTLSRAPAASAPVKLLLGSGAASAGTVLVLGRPPITGTPVHIVFGSSAPPAGVVGAGAGALAFTGAATAAHGIAGTGAGALAFTGAGTAEHTSAGVEGVGAGTLPFTGAATAAHGIAGAAAGALAFTGSATAAHGIAATGAGAIGFTGACVAVHLRYEVRGEVRLGGVLVNRRVRCYKRSTGELTGQADTVAGRYRVHAGFDDAEVATMAIDLAEGATDWIPPTANRLVPVLADDTA